MSKGKIIIFVIINALLFLMILIPAVKAEQIARGSAWHGFPTSEMGDYFHYVYMIKSGQEGRIIFRNAYSEEYFPDFVMQPFYNLLGMASAPFGLSPYAVFFGARLIGIELLFISIFYLAVQYLGFGVFALFAVFLFVFNTSLYSVTFANGWWPVARDPETYSWMFNIFRKFTMLPVHYFFTWSIAIALILRLVKHTSSRASYIGTGVLSFCLVWLHPYVAMIFLYIFLGFVFLESIKKRMIVKELCIHVGLYAMITIPVMVYHGYIFATLWKASTATPYIFSYHAPPIPFTNYIFALGPVLFVAFISLWNPASYSNSLFVLLALWGFLPIILLYIPIAISVPSVRIFQVYQQIPLSLLAAGVVFGITKRFSQTKYFMVLFIALLFAVYAIPAYIYQYNEKTSPNQPFFDYYSKLTLGEGIFTYLNNHSEPGSVVLAGEKISSVMPTVTNNRVILGHDGDQRNFHAKKDEAFTFFLGTMDVGKVGDFLKKYHISYIIFGLDPLVQLPGQYQSLPYFKEVYAREYFGGKMVIVETQNIP